MSLTKNKDKEMISEVSDFRDKKSLRSIKRDRDNMSSLIVESTVIINLHQMYTLIHLHVHTTV